MCNFDSRLTSDYLQDACRIFPTKRVGISIQFAAEKHQSQLKYNFNQLIYIKFNKKLIFPKALVANGLQCSLSCANSIFCYHYVNKAVAGLQDKTFWKSATWPSGLAGC